jgi:putative membrane protein
MLGCEIPLTPDQGEARDWLLEELAKGVYGEISGPIVSFVSDLIDGFFRLLSWRGEGTPPISLILTILAIIAIAALIVVLILHPIRLAKRRSRSVFEEETSAPQVRASFDEAVASQDWNLAYVWAYRLMVLGLDDHDVVSSTPGLTAREAADAATRVAPGLAPQLSTYAETFDKVRYGHSTITREEVDALRSFTPILLDLCSHAKDLS